MPLGRHVAQSAFAMLRAIGDTTRYATVRTLGWTPTDPSAFDRLSRAFTAAGTRRSLTRLLLGPPLLGGIAARLGDASGAAASHRPRGTARRHRHRKRRHKRPPPPAPACPACQTRSAGGQCVADPNQNRTGCAGSGTATSVCCNGTCCPGCCDGSGRVARARSSSPPTRRSRASWAGSVGLMRNAWRGRRPRDCRGRALPATTRPGSRRVPARPPRAFAAPRPVAPPRATA
jgi:hypothetical protein